MPYALQEAVVPYSRRRAAALTFPVFVLFVLLALALVLVLVFVGVSYGVVVVVVAVVVVVFVVDVVCVFVFLRGVMPANVVVRCLDHDGFFFVCGFVCRRWRKRWKTGKGSRCD